MSAFRLSRLAVDGTHAQLARVSARVARPPDCAALPVAWGLQCVALLLLCRACRESASDAAAKKS